MGPMERQRQEIKQQDAPEPKGYSRHAVMGCSRRLPELVEILEHDVHSDNIQRRLNESHDTAVNNHYEKRLDVLCQITIRCTLKILK